VSKRRKEVEREGIDKERVSQKRPWKKTHLPPL
jgi:hypothetical protein